MLFRERCIAVSVYCIAETFEGKKLSQIGEKYDFHGENFRGLLTFAMPPNFMKKTFANHKTMKFAEVFSLESFPLYGNHESALESPTNQDFFQIVCGDPVMFFFYIFRFIL